MGKPAKKSRPNREPIPDESQAAEAVTAAWMLSVMIAFVCELGMVAARVSLRFHADSAWLALAAGFLLFSALVIGLVSLVLLPVVLKTRRVPPPRGVVAFALLVGIAPLVAFLVRFAAAR